METNICLQKLDDLCRSTIQCTYIWKQIADVNDIGLGTEAAWNELGTKNTSVLFIKKRLQRNAFKIYSSSGKLTETTPRSKDLKNIGPNSQKILNPLDNGC